MTDLQLKPITGPGEYTQRNGLKAEIVWQDSKGNWLGWVKLNAEDCDIGMWRSDGSDYGGNEYDLVQPKPEIEIPEELRHAMLDAYDEAVDGFVSELEAVARVAIAWDRANRPKREPTEDEIDECRFVYCRAIDILRDAWPAAIRRAFELAQEPK